jgi:hypothetical protein
MYLYIYSPQSIYVCTVYNCIALHSASLFIIFIQTTPPPNQLNADTIDLVCFPKPIVYNTFLNEHFLILSGYPSQYKIRYEQSNTLHSLLYYDDTTSVVRFLPRIQTITGCLYMVGYNCLDTLCLFNCDYMDD